MEPCGTCRSSASTAVRAPNLRVSPDVSMASVMSITLLHKVISRTLQKSRVPERDGLHCSLHREAWAESSVDRPRRSEAAGEVKAFRVRVADDMQDA